MSQDEQPLVWKIIETDDASLAFDAFLLRLTVDVFGLSIIDIGVITDTNRKMRGKKKDEYNGMCGDRAVR